MASLQERGRARLRSMRGKVLATEPHSGTALRRDEKQLTLCYAESDPLRRRALLRYICSLWRKELHATTAGIHRLRFPEAYILNRG
eukprot:2416407-Pleurochrysis_carterae.AAC.5